MRGRPARPAFVSPDSTSIAAFCGGPGPRLKSRLSATSGLQARQYRGLRLLLYLFERD